jgi:translation initiation factor IF-2
MPKKVYELAKELDVGAIDLVEKLKSEGFEVRNHMVSLSDAEVEKAMLLYKPAEDDKKTTKKKVTKKKKAAKKKTTTKKKVVKKVAKTSGEAKDDEGLEAKSDDAKEDKATKTVVIKKKKKVTKKKVAKKSDDSTETAAAKEQTPEESAKSENSDKSDSDVFQEKMHTFTPVYVPEEGENKTESEKKEKTGKAFDEADAQLVSDDDKDKNSKKRMGNLAAIVNKKGAVGKTKDITNLRAEEEMKLATNIIGRQVYTPVKRKKIYTGETKKTEITEVKDSKRVVQIHGAVTGTDLAQKLSVKLAELKNKCLGMNLLIKGDDFIGLELATEIAALYDYRVEDVKFDEEQVLKDKPKEDKSSLPLRNPIITVMGHVDHGKTTLLDHIRKTKVTDGEAGGITQHIGAYSVPVGDSTLTFLDTPGHAAFGTMRQRGANVTDIVILVVAADDGVMPQTKESIKYAQNANCPIIVAVNKMDKEGANPERVKQELTEFNLVPEDWGGDTMFCPVSALQGDGIDDLLENVKLQAEMMELRETPKGRAEGVIIESKVETGRGPVATVLVQKGTLKKGDAIVCDEYFGRARSLMDHAGNNLEKAGPSIPVQILGLNGVPAPGELLNVVKNEREAKKVVENRVAERKKLENVEKVEVNSLEDFFAQAPEDVSEKRILNLVIRADVQGSYEAIKNAVEALGNDEVGVNIITGGVGAISDNDVNMASNGTGFIIGFNMRPVTSARRLAEEKGVEIRTYTIIYELINDITLALEGMLTPESVEKYIGRAEVRDTFNIPKIGTVAGSAVIDGKIERGCNIRLLREGKIIYDGKLTTLKRFKDEVKEVKNGYECGMALENFNDIKANDLIEAYILEEKARKLEAEGHI